MTQPSCLATLTHKLLVVCLLFAVARLKETDCGKICQYAAGRKDRLYASLAYRPSLRCVVWNGPFSAYISELDSGRVHPRVGSGRVGLGRVGSRKFLNLVGRVGSAIWYKLFYAQTWQKPVSFNLIFFITSVHPKNPPPVGLKKVSTRKKSDNVEPVTGQAAT